MGVPEAEGLLLWSTLTYPQRVKDAIDEAAAVQEGRLAKLLEELAAQKEAFDRLLEKYRADLKACKQLGDYEGWEAAAVAVNELYDGLQEAKETVKDFNAREAVFKAPPTEYPIIDVIEKELDPCFKLWNMIADFNVNQREWMSGSFLAINAPKVRLWLHGWGVGHEWVDERQFYRHQRPQSKPLIARVAWRI